MSKARSSRLARNNGAFFESVIEASCHNYRKKGIADIQKTPEPMRITRAINRQRGIFQAVFAKKAQPDFKGVLKGGQAVIFEAKHTDAASIEQKRVTNVQKLNFDNHQDLGAKCFILVSFQAERFYKVPWTFWRNMKEEVGKVSVNEEDLVEYQIYLKNGFLEFL